MKLFIFIIVAANAFCLPIFAKAECEEDYAGHVVCIDGKGFECATNSAGDMTCGIGCEEGRDGNVVCSNTPAASQVFQYNCMRKLTVGENPSETCRLVISGDTLVLKVRDETYQVTGDGVYSFRESFQLGLQFLSPVLTLSRPSVGQSQIEVAIEEAGEISLREGLACTLVSFP